MHSTTPTAGFPDIFMLMVFGLFAIALIVGLIVMFVKSGRTGKWVIGSIMVAMSLVMLLAMAALWFVPVWREVAVERTYEVAIAEPQPPGVFEVEQVELPAPSTEVIVEESWQSASELGFEADVYPSQESAAEALASQVADLLSKVVPDGQPATAVQVFGRNVDPEVLTAVAAGLRGHDESLEVMVESVPPESRIEHTDRRAVTIKTTVVMQSTSLPPWNRRQPQKTGSLGMHITGAAGELTRSVRFAEKPWVENFAAFVNRDPQRRWVIGLSQEAAASRHEAEREAIRVAAHKLAPDVHQLLERRPNRRISSRPPHLTWTEATIRTELNAGRFVTDRFTQSFIRPYGGQIWREAVLVDASPQAIDGMARICAEHLGHQHLVMKRTVFSIVGVVVLILVVYLFLNAATRGYYVWVLRGAAILVAGGLLFFILRVA